MGYGILNDMSETLYGHNYCTSHLVVGDGTIERVDRPANKGEKVQVKNKHSAEDI